LVEGHTEKFHQGWLITNTRFSTDALQYGKCMGMQLVGWDYPNNNGLRNWIDSSGKMIKGVPIHVRGSIVYNNLLKNVNSGEYPYIKNGDKIKFIYLKTPNKTHSHVISFLDNLPPELELASAVDKETQFSKTFLEPLKTLTDIVGWNTEKTYTLDIFFQ